VSRPPRPDRRYSDEEFRWILEKATREPGPPREGAEDVAPGAPPEGLTLDTIREIAREVGIAEGAVDRAAASLESGVVVRSGPGSGTSFRAAWRVERRITEPEMRMLLLEAERILGTTGTRERTRDGIRWRATEQRIEVEIARGPDSTELLGSADTGGSLLVGWMVFGVMGLGGIALAWSAWPASVFVVGPLGLLATGAVMWLYRLGVRVGPRGELRRLLEELRLAVSLEEEG
jgi:hypothetical protein